MTPTLFPYEPWTDPNTTRFEAVHLYLTTKDLFYVWDENMQAWFDMRTGDLIEKEQMFEKSWEKTDMFQNPFPSGDPFRAKKHIMLQFLKRETDEHLDILRHTVKKYYEFVKQKQIRGINKQCLLIWIMSLVRPENFERYYGYWSPGWHNMLRYGILLNIKNKTLMKICSEKLYLQGTNYTSTAKEGPS